MKSQALIYEKREAQTVEYWKRELVVYDSKGVLQMMRVIKYQAPRKSGGRPPGDRDRARRRTGMERTVRLQG